MYDWFAKCFSGSRRKYPGSKKESSNGTETQCHVSDKVVRLYQNHIFLASYPVSLCERESLVTTLCTNVNQALKACTVSEICPQDIWISCCVYDSVLHWDSIILQYVCLAFDIMLIPFSLDINFVSVTLHFVVYVLKVALLVS